MGYKVYEGNHHIIHKILLKLVISGYPFMDTTTSGWRFQPQRYEFVSWDDEIPSKKHVPKQQPDLYL